MVGFRVWTQKLGIQRPTLGLNPEFGKLINGRIQSLNPEIGHPKSKGWILGLNPEFGDLINGRIQGLNLEIGHPKADSGSEPRIWVSKGKF